MSEAQKRLRSQLNSYAESVTRLPAVADLIPGLHETYTYEDVGGFLNIHVAVEASRGMMLTLFGYMDGEAGQEAHITGAWHTEVHSYAAILDIRYENGKCVAYPVTGVAGSIDALVNALRRTVNASKYN